MAIPDACDAALLDAWKAGDKRAGETLVARHFETVYWFFARRGEVDAEDLTQRTFLACLEKREELREPGKFRRFLLRVARYELLMAYRGREYSGRKRVLRSAEPGSIRTSPSRLAADYEEQRLLLGALRMLSLDLQMTVELFYWEQLGVEEVADVLEVAPGTVKWRLSQARTLLKQHLMAANAPARLRESTVSHFEDWARSLAGAARGDRSDRSE